MSASTGLLAQVYNKSKEIGGSSNYTTDAIRFLETIPSSSELENWINSEEGFNQFYSLINSSSIINIFVVKDILNSVSQKEELFNAILNIENFETVASSKRSIENICDSKDIFQKVINSKNAMEYIVQSDVALDVFKKLDENFIEDLVNSDNAMKSITSSGDALVKLLNPLLLYESSYKTIWSNKEYANAIFSSFNSFTPNHLQWNPVTEYTHDKRKEKGFIGYGGWVDNQVQITYGASEDFSYLSPINNDNFPEVDLDMFSDTPSQSILVFIDGGKTGKQTVGWNLDLTDISYITFQYKQNDNNVPLAIYIDNEIKFINYKTTEFWAFGGIDVKEHGICKIEFGLAESIHGSNNWRGFTNFRFFKEEFPQSIFNWPEKEFELYDPNINLDDNNFYTYNGLKEALNIEKVKTQLKDNNDNVLNVSSFSENDFLFKNYFYNVPIEIQNIQPYYITGLAFSNIEENDLYDPSFELETEINGNEFLTRYCDKIEILIEDQENKEVGSEILNFVDKEFVIPSFNPYFSIQNKDGILNAPEQEFNIEVEMDENNLEKTHWSVEDENGNELMSNVIDGVETDIEIPNIISVSSKVSIETKSIKDGDLYVPEYPLYIDLSIGDNLYNQTTYELIDNDNGETLISETFYTQKEYIKIDPVKVIK